MPETDAQLVWGFAKIIGSGKIKITIKKTDWRWQMKLNKNKVGMVLALFFALWALIWDIVMAVGLGQWILNVKLRMIFLPVDALKLTPFRIDKALLLIVLAYIGGYIIGWIFSWIWNWANKNEH